MRFGDQELTSENYSEINSIVIVGIVIQCLKGVGSIVSRLTKIANKSIKVKT